MIWLATKVVDITPSESLPLAGYAVKDRNSSKVHSSLEANVIVLKSEVNFVVLIGIDTLFVGRDFADNISKEVRRISSLSEDFEIAFISTHTHTAPSLDSDKPALGEVNSDYYDGCVRKLVAAVVPLLGECGSKIQAVKTGRCKSENTVYRRKKTLGRNSGQLAFKYSVFMVPNFDVEVNSDVEVIILYDAENRAKCCMWSWPCHAIAAPCINEISSDFPGAIRDYLREELENPEMPVVYMPGFAGDLRPTFIRDRKSLRDMLTLPFSQLFCESDAKSFSFLCSELSTAVNTILGSGMTNVQIADHGISDEENSIDLSSLISEYRGVYKKLLVRKIGIGPITICLANAEMSSQYYSINKRPANTFYSGYAQNCFGYLPTDDQIKNKGYEVSGFFAYFSIVGKFKKNIQGKILDLLNF